MVPFLQNGPTGKSLFYLFAAQSLCLKWLVRKVIGWSKETRLGKQLAGLLYITLPASLLQTCLISIHSLYMCIYIYIYPRDFQHTIGICYHVMCFCYFTNQQKKGWPFESLAFCGKSSNDWSSTRTETLMMKALIIKHSLIIHSYVNITTNSSHILTTKLLFVSHIWFLLIRG